MITDPKRYAKDFAKAGANVLTFHWEVAPSAERAREVIAEFRKHRVPRVGVSINPDHPVEPLAPILGEVDLVLVMSVFPGFSGQKFMPEVLPKVRWLREHGYKGDLEMDGGISEQTLPACAAAGTNVFVSGSTIFGSPDAARTIARFRELARREREKPARTHSS
jgi:ribulose-phosphate 3-epimerase